MSVIAIRVDSSHQIGIGHVMRCLTLAYKLRDNDIEVTFICKEFPGNSISFIKSNEFLVLTIPFVANSSINTRELGTSQEVDAKATIDLLDDIGYKTVDCIVVDNYELDAKWHGVARQVTKKILIIDDLANREYDCDAIIDQTLGRSESEYRELVPAECQILTGTKFTLLREEFCLNESDIRQHRKMREKGGVKHLLVMMGGTDPDNFTSKILKEICLYKVFSKISVVLASNAPHLQAVQELSNINTSIDLIINSQNISKILLDNDVCIGAAGTSAWERCSLGLPSILFVLADNQKKIANELEISGAALTFSHLRCIEDIKIELDKIVEKDKYLTMVNNCLKICDGQGVSRVFNKVFECQN